MFNIIINIINTIIFIIINTIINKFEKQDYNYWKKNHRFDLKGKIIIIIIIIIFIIFNMIYIIINKFLKNIITIKKIVIRSCMVARPK